jgi:hypothetical protein
MMIIQLNKYHKHQLNQESGQILPTAEFNFNCVCVVCLIELCIKIGQLLHLLTN